MIVIDGEPLAYERSITWECFPGNIEILVDDSMFVSNRTFTRRITPEIEKDRVIRQAVDKIWVDYDKDKSGALDRVETKNFLKDVLSNMPPPNNFDDSKFELTFNSIDKNSNGLIEKVEMVAFIKALTRA